MAMLRDFSHWTNTLRQRPGMLDGRKKPVLSHPDPDNEADPGQSQSSLQARCCYLSMQGIVDDDLWCIDDTDVS